MTTRRGTPIQRRVWSVVWLLGLLVPVEVWALGLGDAEVRSFLNQPLEVVIPLAVSSADERDGLKVALASNEDFLRVGLNRANLTVPITVELIDRPAGPVVRLTSSRPITDPFLQLLLDASWSSGRLLRQYTLFLDPPLAGEPTLAVRPEPAAPAAEPPPRRAPVTAQPAVPPAAPAVAAPVEMTPAIPAGGTYGPVAAGETLWRIAERHNPDRTAYSNNQVMLAFVRLNPEAFDDGNINRLHKGAHLLVPDRAAITLLDAEEARRIASEQHAAWRALSGSQSGGQSGTQSSGSTAADSGAAPAAIAAERDIQTQLKLVPPDGNGEDGTLRDSATVRAELARLEEELLTTRLENQDLARQVQDLRDELERLRGFEVVDPELAEFQEYLADAQQADTSSPEAVTAEGTTAEGTTAEEAAGAGTTGETQSAASDLAVASPPAQTAAVTPEPAVAPQPAARTSRTWVTGTMAIIAGIGLLAVVSLIWLQKRRRGDAAPATMLADHVVRDRTPSQAKSRPKPQAAGKPPASAAPPARQPAAPAPVSAVRVPPPPAPAPAVVPPAPAGRTPAQTGDTESPALDEKTRDLLKRLQAEDKRLAGDETPAAGAAPTADEDTGLDRGGKEDKPKTTPATDTDPFDSVLKLVKEEEEDVFEGAEGDRARGLPGGSGEDDIEIKLDLARAYISMGDADAARTIIDEVMEEGNEAQRAEGRNLLKQL